jgi:murein DD-endopeptidase MepM/ murein hydrolase activator NlpD
MPAARQSAVRSKFSRARTPHGLVLLATSAMLLVFLLTGAASAVGAAPDPKRSLGSTPTGARDQAGSVESIDLPTPAPSPSSPAGSSPSLSPSASPAAEASTPACASPSVSVSETPTPTTKHAPEASPSATPDSAPSTGSAETDGSSSPSPSAGDETPGEPAPDDPCPSPSASFSPASSPSAEGTIVPLPPASTRPARSAPPTARGPNPERSTPRRSKRRDATPVEARRPWTPDRQWGTYGTTSLVRAAHAAAHKHPGYRRQRIARKIYAPFPVAGLAWWSDSWGAPRYAGGYHPHHGQDVLCNTGTPLLAVQAGTIQLGSDPLGGTTVKLLRPDGSLWYYAHLESYAPGVDSGSHVRAGTIIGRCGSTGDATVPHLHICRFAPDGSAVDPMAYLVRWLRLAERRIGADMNRHVEPPVETTTAEQSSLPVVASLQRPISIADAVPPISPSPRGATPLGPTLGVEALVLALLFGVQRGRRAAVANRRRTG